MPTVVTLLTDRQHRILDFFRVYYVSFDRPPTLSEIAVACGLSPTSINVVLDALTTLQRMRWIRRVPGRPRALELLDPTDGTTS